MAIASGKTSNLTQGGISIADAIIGTDGSGLISLQNNSGDRMTITGISIDGADNNFNKRIGLGSRFLFSLSNLENACSCAGNEGKTKTCEAVIYYTSGSGIGKKDTYSVTIECAATALAANNGGAVDTNGVITPEGVVFVTLSSPSAGATVSSNSTNFIFNVSASNSLSSCDLLVDNVSRAQLTGVVNNSSNTITYNLSALGAGLHTWDVNCVDTLGISDSPATRNITYTIIGTDTTPPTIALSSPSDNIFSYGGTTSFLFSAGDNNDLQKCILLIDGVDKNEVSSPAQGSNSIYYSIDSLSFGTHIWDINCIDYSNNSAKASASRNLTLARVESDCTSHSAGGYFSGGDGSSTTPYGICDCVMLQKIDSNLTARYALLKDINCADTINWNSGKGFTPISSFNGFLDGNAKTISKLYIRKTLTEGANCERGGIFDSILSGGKVQKLAIVDSNVIVFIGQYNSFALGTSWCNNQSGGNSGEVGLLAGINYGIISSVTVKSSGVGPNMNGTGGIAGNNSGTILNSYSTANVTSNSSGAGGFSTTCYGTTINSYTAGTVNGLAAGVLVYNGGPLVNSFASGRTVGSTYTHGLTGYVGSATNSYCDLYRTEQAECGTGTGVNSGNSNPTWAYYDTNEPMASWGTWTNISGNKYSTTDGNWSICRGAGYPWLTWENKAC
ncbi:Uncharacterised protein [uncultured archaeon]|nr:Uncharacterised protein [uncultured archaeon]